MIIKNNIKFFSKILHKLDRFDIYKKFYDPSNA